MESKVHSIKVPKYIKISPYIRSGAPVKGYHRLQQVKIPQLEKEFKDIKLTPFDEFVNKAKSLDYNNKSDFQSKLLSLYSEGIHGISDPGISRNKEHLYKTFNKVADIFSYYELLLDPRRAFKKLTDEKYLTQLHQYSIHLEKKFNKEFGLETERVNQFIFRTKLNLPDNEKIHSHEYTKLSNMMMSFLDSINEKHTMNIDEGFERASNSLDGLIRDADIPQQKLEKTLVPALFLTNMFGPECLSDKEVLSTDIGKELRNGLINIHPYLMHCMKSDSFNFPKDLKNYSATIKDPDNDIRKPLLKWLNNVSNNPEYGISNVHNMDHIETSRKQIIDHFKKIQSDEIVPNFIYMMEKGMCFNGFKNSNFKEKFNGFCKKMTQEMFDIQNSKHGYVYISNNPMDFITMSPQSSITSCQSITEKNGKLKVNEYNVNVLNSLKLNDSHDFMMYTLDGNPARKNTKVDRISLHHDVAGDNFISCEEKKIYSKNQTSQLNRWLTYDDKGKNINRNIFSEFHDVYSDAIDNFSPDNLFDYHLDKYTVAEEDIHNLYSKTISDTEKLSYKNFENDDEIDKYVEKKKRDFDDIIGPNELSDQHYNSMLFETSRKIMSDFEKVFTDIIDKEDDIGGSFLYGGKMQQCLTTLAQDFNTNDNELGIVRTIRQSSNDYISVCVNNIIKKRDLFDDHLDSWSSRIKDELKKHNKQEI